MTCGFCGKENDEASRFCIDCGKPIVTGGARVIPVASIMAGRRSSQAAEPRGSQGPQGAAAQASSGAPATDGRGSKGLPDTRVSSATQPKGGAVRQCSHCRAMIDPGFPFCPQCGTRADAGTPTASPASGTATFSAVATSSGPKLSVMNEAGEVVQTITVDRGEATFGRSEADFRFGKDVFLSPVHAQLTSRAGQLFVRDLGSRNGTWLFIDGPYRLQDGDTILVGSQLIRFRRLGYPGPHPPEADQTRRLGSLTPSADIAVLAQLRADGSARDTYHLSPGRSIKLGRDSGDWVFPYDQTMSGRHAEVRSEDLEFIVLDDGSRNGVAVSVRGEKPVKAGQRFLIGDQTIRVDSI